MISKKTIRIRLVKVPRGTVVDDREYVVKQMMNAVVLEKRDWGVGQDVRVGDSLNETQAKTLTMCPSLEVTVSE